MGAPFLLYPLYRNCQAQAALQPPLDARHIDYLVANGSPRKVKLEGHQERFL